MAHNPAILFRIEKRGFIREGYKADLVLVEFKRKLDPLKKKTSSTNAAGVQLEGMNFHSKVTHTFVNGKSGL